MQGKKSVCTLFYLLSSLWCISYSLPSNAFGLWACQGLFVEGQSSRESKESDSLKGAAFLHQKQPDLHLTDAVHWAVQSLKISANQLLIKPNAKINAWLKILESMQERHQEPLILQRIKESFYNQYVIKAENIPENYFINQAKLARNLGYGKMDLSKEAKKAMAENLIRDQKQFLDQWVEYFFSSESKHYPIWLKYWMFQGMLKLGKYDAETGKFKSRTEDMVSPFADLNKEALAIVADAMIYKVLGQNFDTLSDKVLIDYLKDPHFGKLYGRALYNLADIRINTEVVEGHWVKYDKGSDPTKLVNSLKGMNTGWCTAGHSTALEQLKNGDFYVYYAKDENQTARIPRIAIRMENNKIAEIRGVAKDQNIDSRIAQSNVLNEKLKEFGTQGELYYKKTNDMKLLSEIEKKHTEGQRLSVSELKFLYEIENPIEGFGTKKDPRIQEIMNARDMRQDLSDVYHVKKSEVSLTKEEFLQKKTKVHYGDLMFDLKSDSKILLRVGRLVLPEIVIGDVEFYNFYSLQNVIFPNSLRKLRIDIVNNPFLNDVLINLQNLTATEVIITGVNSADSIIWPKSVRNLSAEIKTSGKGIDLHNLEIETLQFYYLTTMEGVILPKSLQNIFLNSLENGKGLNLKNYTMDMVNLGNIKTLEDVELPKLFRSLILHSLEVARGLDLSHLDMETLSLGKITHMGDIIMPKSLINLDMNSLIDGKGLHLNNYDMGIVKLSSIKKIDDFLPPKSVLDLHLNSLEDGSGLTLENKIIRYLNLASLKKLKGFTMPSSAQSINLAGLVVPELIKGPKLSAIQFFNITGAQLPLKLKQIQLSNVWYQGDAIVYP